MALKQKQHNDREKILQIMPYGQNTDLTIKIIPRLQRNIPAKISDIPINGLIFNLKIGASFYI